MPQGEFAQAITEQFEALPKIVQEAILSADVEKRLRELWTKKQLHIDQWSSLQDEVMLALLGLRRVEDLQEHIEKRVGVSAETAASLAAEISSTIFEPIRQELERELEHPEAKAKEVSDVETARSQILKDTAPADSGMPPPAPPVMPATPPSPAPAQKAVRGPASGAYRSGEPSATRKDIVDDPYREAPQ